MKLYNKYLLKSEIYFIFFAIYLLILAKRYPIKVPITDDWLYLGLGSHQTQILKISLFELVGGHQQILTKITIWFVGFFPGNYVQNLIISNIFFALFGFYYLLISQFSREYRINSPFILIPPTLIVFNLKPLYLYMSATGLGLCQSIFLIGVYFYARNIETGMKSRILTLLTLFLSPFTTGMGLALPISHAIHLIYKFFTNKDKSYRCFLLDSFIIVVSLFFAYLLPSITDNVNSRTPQVSSTDFHRLILFLYNPAHFISFALALIGNPIVPSSRLDPYVSFGLGILVLILFATIVSKIFSQINFSKTIFANKNPILVGISFLYLTSSFRSADQYFSLDSSAPRYVFGGMLLLLGIQAIILKNYSTFSKRIDKALVCALVILITFSVSGVKTGMEWIKVRSMQSSKLYECVLDTKRSRELCVYEADIIREADSSNKELIADLIMLEEYFKDRKIIKP